jgi:hypothetical protein
MFDVCAKVGAINTQILSTPWMDVDAIDLISRNERIEQIDFFDVEVEHPFMHLMTPNNWMCATA